MYPPLASNTVGTCCGQNYTLIIKYPQKFTQKNSKILWKAQNMHWYQESQAGKEGLIYWSIEKYLFSTKQ